MDADLQDVETPAPAAGNTIDYDTQLKAAQWAFEHYLSQGKETTGQITVVTGAFLVLSTISIFFNIGTIDTVNLEAVVFKADFTGSTALKIMLFAATTLCLLAMLFLAVFMQRYAIAVEYFAGLGLPRAEYAVQFEHWLQKQRPVFQKLNMLVSFAVLATGIVLYGAVILTFIVSFL